MLIFESTESCKELLPDDPKEKHGLDTSKKSTCIFLMFPGFGKLYVYNLLPKGFLHP